MKARGQQSSRERPSFRYFAVSLVLLGAASGCSPKIGDDCATSTDCSLNGDRLCDITQPGGYCTVFNCEPNGCPEGSACVAFNETTCSEPSVSSRFRRTFCMKACNSDSDCRGGDYRCLDTTNEPTRVVVDIDPSSRRICAVPPSVLVGTAGTTPTSGEPAVCSPSDASFDTSRPEGGSGTSDGRSDGTVDASVDSSLDARDATIDADRAETANDPRTDRGDTRETGGDVDLDDVTSDDVVDEADVINGADVVDAGAIEAAVDAPSDSVPSSDVGSDGSND